MNDLGILFALIGVLGWARYLRERTETQRRKNQVEYWWHRWQYSRKYGGTDTAVTLDEALR